QDLNYMLELGRKTRWFHARISPILAADASSRTVCALVRDVTEHREASEALKNKNHEIVTIWESMTDAFYAVDTEWRFTYVNAQAALALNTTPEELLGTHVWDAFPEVMVTRFYQEYRKAVDTKATVNFEAF